MLQNQRRSDRPKTPRRRADQRVEGLESRTLMAADPFSFYHIQPLNPGVVGRGRGDIHNYASLPATAAGRRELDITDNEGKTITGKNRLGNEYVIKVHGPGYAIVTDATPNDGVLGDDLVTIQLVNTDPHRTLVAAQVIGSARVVSDGTIVFQKLIAQDGVKSIKLNGFTLTQVVAPPAGQPNYSDTGIFLNGGVEELQFHNIDATFDLANGDAPIRVVIGDGSTPLRQAPIIRLDSIFNTVVNSSLATQPAGVPQTVPSVSIEVNGQLRGLDIISSTAQPVIAGQQQNFSPVAITGRTAVRAVSIGNVRVAGSARNVTFSRGPLQTRRVFVGTQRVKSATFGGNADGVAIIAEGRIGKLRFNRGLGNPAGTSAAGTSLGLPANELGYPAFGLLGGLVSAESIGGIGAYPANVQLSTPSDPDLMQLDRTNSTYYIATPGAAFTNAALLSSLSIDHVNVVGNSINSEIKSGFHYPSYLAGLEGTRAPSQIGRLTQNGSLVDSVNSATYRPNDGIYGNGNDGVGLGRIRGRQSGRLYVNGSQTALGNLGAGNYARVKVGHLPPPQGPLRRG